MAASDTPSAQFICKEAGYDPMVCAADCHTGRYSRLDRCTCVLSTFRRWLKSNEHSNDPQGRQIQQSLLDRRDRPSFTRRQLRGRHRRRVDRGTVVSGLSSCGDYAASSYTIVDRDGDHRPGRSRGSTGTRHAGHQNRFGLGKAVIMRITPDSR